MEDIRQHFECENCGAEYSLQTDMDIDPTYCPFCGEPLDTISWENDYENIDGESEG